MGAAGRTGGAHLSGFAFRGRSREGTLSQNLFSGDSDHGPGIPPNELPFVKKKFYKGSSKERGSGIGLAVCDENELLASPAGVISERDMQKQSAGQ